MGKAMSRRGSGRLAIRAIRSVNEMRGLISLIVRVPYSDRVASAERR